MATESVHADPAASLQLAGEPHVAASASPGDRPRSGLKAATLAPGRVGRRVEWLLLAAAAPTLLFPGRFTWLGGVLILTTWLARRAATGRWTVPTGVNAFVVLLLAGLGLSLLPSVRLDYSLSKFWGILLGVAVLYACLNTCHTATALYRAERILLLAGSAIAVLGYFVMSAPPDKLMDDHLYGVLPHLSITIPSSTEVSDGVNPNELAGVLVLLAPLGAALALRGGRLRSPAAAAALLMIAALLLTQSRAGIIGLGAATGVGVLVILKRRAIAIVAVGLLLALLVVANGSFVDRFREQSAGEAQISNVESLSGRMELWQRGLAMALDMPLTGIGLNSFPIVVQEFYPTILHQRSMFIRHVHNLYLQTLLDLGAVGFVGWMLITVVAVREGLRAVRMRSDSYLAGGLLVGLLAHGTYGLLDAVALGAKPGVLLWATFGILLALGQRARATAQPGLVSQNLHSRAPGRQMVWAVACFTLIALLVLVVAPLNTAVLLLHKSTTTDSPLVASALRLAGGWAPGPLAARVQVAHALDAHLRSDQAGEDSALSYALVDGSWDTSIGLRLGDLRYATGDVDGAVQAWHLAHAVDPLLYAAASPPAADSLQWYLLAQRVEPTDWRAYRYASRLLRPDDPRTARFVSEALILRGDQPARVAVARRLVDPLSPLPNDASPSASAIDGELFNRAAGVLLDRRDLAGAQFAARIATDVAPQLSDGWSTLATVFDQAGLTVQAAQARAHVRGQ